MNSLARLAAAIGFVVLLGGMKSEGRWGPNGNGTLNRDEDRLWVAFHDTKIATNLSKGEYVATFTPALVKLDGASFDITGYMLPLSTNWTSPHFILTRRSSGCPFCPPNEPNEAIDVYFDQPVAFTDAPIKVAGQLRLLAQTGDGLFYRLDHAKLL